MITQLRSHTRTFLFSYIVFRLNFATVVNEHNTAYQTTENSVLLNNYLQFHTFLSCSDSAAYLCYTCQYSENVSLIGYECVTSPGNYSIGPATGVCSAPCYTLRQVSLSKYTVVIAYRQQQKPDLWSISVQLPDSTTKLPISREFC